MDTLDLSALTAQLNTEESCRLKPYIDIKGKMTIGWGRNLTDVGISQVEADFLRTNDIQAAIADCQKLSWFQALNGVRQQVIVDLRFNLGLHGLLEFHQMIAAIIVGNFDWAAAALLDSAAARLLPIRYAHLAAMLKTGLA